MERSVLQGLAAFRWGAWLWMATVLLVSRHDLERPWLAVALAGVALAVTVAGTVRLRDNPSALCRPGPVLTEVAVGILLILGDGVAYGEGHAFSTSQSLGSVWPLAGILSMGVALGPVAAAGAGVLIGIARLGAVLANGAAIDTGGRALSVINTVVFYALGGAAAGYLARLLRRAEDEISAARAREEVARTLHDGVLQTLAVVERGPRTRPCPGWLAIRSGSCATGCSAPPPTPRWSPISAPPCGRRPPVSRRPSVAGPRCWSPTTCRRCRRRSWPP